MTEQGYYENISIGFELETNYMSLIERTDTNEIKLPIEKFDNYIIKKSIKSDYSELYCYNDSFVEFRDRRVETFRQKHVSQGKKKYSIIQGIDIENILHPFNNAEFVSTFFKLQTVKKGQEKLFLLHHLSDSFQKIEDYLSNLLYTEISLKENTEFPYKYYFPQKDYGFLSVSNNIQKIVFKCQCTIGIPLNEVIEFLMRLDPEDGIGKKVLERIDYVEREWMGDEKLDDMYVKGYLFLFLYNTLEGHNIRKKNQYVLRSSFFKVQSLLTKKQMDQLHRFFSIVKEKTPLLSNEQERIKIQQSIDVSLFEEINAPPHKQKQIQTKALAMVTPIFKKDSHKRVFIEIRNIQYFLFGTRTALTLEKMKNRLREIASELLKRK
jgi:hypothetical protein